MRFHLSKIDWLLIAGVTLLAALFAFVPGCATVPHPATQPVHEFVGPGSVPASLKVVATGLNTFILFSTVVVGIGIGLFFLLPTAHNLSLALVFLGGGVESSSLITRVSLWIVPYFTIGLAVLAVAAFIYELYANRMKLEVTIQTAETKLKGLADQAEADIKKV